MTNRELRDRAKAAWADRDREWAKREQIVRRAKRERDPAKRRALWAQADAQAGKILAAARVADKYEAALEWRRGF